MSKTKIDYAFKSHVLNNYPSLVLSQRKASYKSFCIANYEEDGVYNKCIDDNSPDLPTLHTFCKSNGLEKEFLECRKLNDAFYHRQKRLRARVETMLKNGNCIFITLTFNDDCLKNTNEKQRRTFVSRYLKTFNSMYIANIDFGKENNREHYHAIIQSDNIDLSEWRKHGNINVERIRNRDIDKDCIRLSKYVAKLSNHAIKETTKRSTLIYSR